MFIKTLFLGGLWLKDREQYKKQFFIFYFIFENIYWRFVTSYQQTTIGKLYKFIEIKVFVKKIK